MEELRRSWYWDSYDDDDLIHLIKSHDANIMHHCAEIKRIEKELKEGQEWDEKNASISRQ